MSLLFERLINVVQLFVNSRSATSILISVCALVVSIFSYYNSKKATSLLIITEKKDTMINRSLNKLLSFFGF